MRPSETDRGLRSALGIAISIAIVAATATAAHAQFNIGNTVPPLPTGTNQTHYQGAAGSTPPWQNLASDPGGFHVYNPTTHIISLTNVFVQENTKTLWMDLWFNSTGQPGSDVGWNGGNNGQPFAPNAGNWATASGSAAGGGAIPGVPTAASVVRNTTVNPHQLHLYQTFTFTPQPADERIDISQVLLHITNGTLFAIETRTACNPTPAPGAAMGLAGGLLAMSVRRRRPR